MSELNRAWWDERVPLHVASDFYDVAGFKAGAGTLRPFELDEVGDVAGRTLVHLQCHFGLDTLSWARQGARVTGLDFSEPAIDAARSLAAVIDAGLEIELLHEHDYTLFARWPFLEGRDGLYRQPEGKPRLPLMYSLRARAR